jgi:hypothetical protein
MGAHLAAPLRLGGPVVASGKSQTVTGTWKIKVNQAGRTAAILNPTGWDREQLMSDNHLNAQQIQHLQKQTEAALQQTVANMQLRKWAVEQAFMVTSLFINADGRHPAYQMDEKGHVERLPPLGDPMALAEAVYEFVSKSATVKVEIGG